MLIKNGLIVNSNKIFKGDIKIENSKIVDIKEEILDDDKEIIDATNKIVIAGGIDVHTHLDLDVKIAKASDDFYTGTVAGAIGGTTTIIDHIGFGEKNCSLFSQIEKYHKLAKGKAVIDYSFHGVIQHVNENTFSEMEELAKEGITSFKIYLTYDFKLNDDEIIKVLSYAKKLGIIIAVHPENDAIINSLKEKYKKNNLLTPIYHLKSRPIEAEAEAINKMIFLAKMCDEAPIYIVHLSNGLGLELIVDAKKRGQKNIFTETCPQYLYLNEDLYKKEDALKYIMSPPLRSKENNDLLFKGIRNKDIDIIGTDHCPFFYEKEKQLGKEDFTKCPNGVGGIESRMMLMLNAVNENKITLQDFVATCSENPAKLFGLYPKKGVLEIGSDADIVIFDTEKEITITKDILHENVDYTPYENIKIKGVPTLTILRGKIIAKDGNFLGTKGEGEFIKRDKSKLIT